MITAAQRVMLERLVKRNIDAGNATVMYGISVTEMSRDELIATIGYLNRHAAETRIRHSQQQKTLRKIKQG